MNAPILTAAQAAASPSLATIFLSEFLGTAVLLLLGIGVVANVLLRDTKGFNAGWLTITFGWGFAVYAGVYVAWRTGGHLNPAVTLMKAVWYMFDPNITMNGVALDKGGIPVTAATVTVYLLGEFVGAFAGAVLAWLTYKTHYDTDTAPELKLGTFSTAPQHRNYLWNTITEVIGTFVLLAWIMVSGGTPTQVGPLAVALIVVVIGISLGGPTGYAINQARDLGPRIAHAVLPIKGKGGSDWAYSWVPVVGPTIAALITPPIIIAIGLAV